jgi:pimeloyl-ACP methyl ester carboxylesterase
MATPRDHGELVPLPDGRRLQVWHGGDPLGPVTFFLPGCPDSRLAAEPGAPAAAAAGVHLVAVNRPGYGRSDRHASDHLSVADDVAAVADHLGADRYTVLGMSLGGGYALACGARSPDRVEAVAAVATPGPLPDLDEPWHRDDLADEQKAFLARLAACTVEEAMELMRPEFEDYVARVAPEDPDDAAVAARFLGGLPPLDAELVAVRPASSVAQQTREALGCHDGYLRDAAVAFRSWEFRLEDVRCPVSLWYGALDANAPARHGSWLAQRLPRARLEVLPEATHLATLLLHWDEILRSLSAAT